MTESPVVYDLVMSRKDRPLAQIMSTCESMIARGVDIEAIRRLLTQSEFDAWVKEANLRWRLTKPLHSVHGTRQKRRNLKDGKPVKS